MAYNNFFPGGYQPAYYPQYYPQPATPVQQTMPQQQAQAPAVSSGIIWVQGEAGAKSYQVAPNTAVQLWDSENQIIYLKSADANGIPSIKVLDYTIRKSPQNTPNFGGNGPEIGFATKDEINTLSTRLDALQAKIDAIAAKPVGKPRKEVQTDE